jgi:sporulation protein YlmC with PRC-barrel domain
MKSRGHRVIISNLNSNKFDLSSPIDNKKDNNIYIVKSNVLNMPIDKKPLREFINKPVVTKEGKRLGIVKDITFEARTGELIQLLLKEQTPYTKSLNLETNTGKETILPYNSIIAVADFVVVSEEDLI